MSFNGTEVCKSYQNKDLSCIIPEAEPAAFTVFLGLIRVESPEGMSPSISTPGA